MSEDTLRPDTTIKEYAIKRVLGRGSFGITYLAERINEHYAVAIKEYFPTEFVERGTDGTTVNPVRPSADPSEDFQSGLEKFLEESRLLGSFESPHIVRVVDTFELNGTAYMVMQYEEGATLARHLNSHQKPLDESQILSIFVPVLEGLRTIHAKWLLHRDIKPDNIYIRKDGSPLLIDFGTARHALSAKRGGMTEYLTPGYAPPEQYDRTADHGPWTDIYAVGATMYYCVTRITPFEGRFRNEAHDPVMPAVEAAPGFYDKRLLEIIDWMMTPDSTQRPQSVDEALSRLNKLAAEKASVVKEGQQGLAATARRTATGPGPSTDKRRTEKLGATEAAQHAKAAPARAAPATDARLKWAAAGVGALVLVAAAGFWVQNRSPGPEQPEQVAMNTGGGQGGAGAAPTEDQAAAVENTAATGDASSEVDSGVAETETAATQDSQNDAVDATTTAAKTVETQTSKPATGDKPAVSEAASATDSGSGETGTSAAEDSRSDAADTAPARDSQGGATESAAKSVEETRSGETTAGEKPAVSEAASAKDSGSVETATVAVQGSQSGAGEAAAKNQSSKATAGDKSTESGAGAVADSGSGETGTAVTQDSQSGGAAADTAAATDSTGQRNDTPANLDPAAETAGDSSAPSGTTATGEPPAADAETEPAPAADAQAGTTSNESAAAQTAATTGGSDATGGTSGSSQGSSAPASSTEATDTSRATNTSASAAASGGAPTCDPTDPGGACYNPLFDPNAVASSASGGTGDAAVDPAALPGLSPQTVPGYDGTPNAPQQGQPINPDYTRDPMQEVEDIEKIIEAESRAGGTTIARAVPQPGSDIAFEFGTPPDVPKEVSCDDRNESGSTRPERYVINVGAGAGDIALAWNMFSSKGHIVVNGPGIHFATGCVSGKGLEFLTKTGTGTHVTVDIQPNCGPSQSGGNTQWMFTLSCPQ